MLISQNSYKNSPDPGSKYNLDEVDLEQQCIHKLQQVNVINNEISDSCMRMASWRGHI
uniref:Uncharacterized protein n=1 Tax=Arundo donax TaxID=35708 RepID=A0A0A8YYC9_ARUDO